MADKPVWVEIRELVWTHAPYRGNKLLAALVLAEHVDSDAICWPGVRRIAKRSRQSERNARYCLRKFETDGFISTERRENTSSCYRINVAWLLARKPIERQNRAGGQKLPQVGQNAATKWGKNQPRNKDERFTEQPQNKTLPPNPPKGGLTPRERANLGKEIDQIYRANQGRKLNHDDVVRAACARLVLPLDDAIAAITASEGLPDTSPQVESSSPGPQKSGEAVA